MVVKRNNIINDFNYSQKQLVNLLTPKTHPFPELEKFLNKPLKLSKKKHVREVLSFMKNGITSIKNIPKITPALYNSFFKTGKRETFEKPYNKRRRNLSIAIFLYILGSTKFKAIIEKYFLAICDEESWVMPFHKGRLIDLYSVNTALELAEALLMVENKIDIEVAGTVRRSIEEKIFYPYLNQTSKHKWYKNHDNWNAVCNSNIASTFLLLENDTARKARAIKKALDSLKVYIDKAFYEDGGTSEGINYWNYGMGNFIIFSEMLKESTKGSINLLNTERIRQIASFPSKIQLGPEIFASFSDVEENGTTFNPGIIQKLSKSTGEKSLLNLIPISAKPDWFGVTTILRFILWWDGHRINKNNLIQNTLLPNLGIARLTNNSRKTPVTVIIKAGHNNENHNHNDIGSYILNTAGENFITDPGAGIYNKDYFSAKRYNNIFTNSFGHGVPRINNKLQSNGKESFGKLISYDISEHKKRVVIEFAKAYKIKSLKSLKREIVLSNQNSKLKDTIILNDKYVFLKNSFRIEEVFITWLPVTIENKKAIIHGKNHNLILSIDRPDNTSKFSLNELKKDSKVNKKPHILKRITFFIPKTTKNTISVKISMKVEKNKVF